jgi:FeS assembly protein IscX
MKTFGWLEVGLIGELLAEHFPQKDPLRTGFPELRQMVLSLPGFQEEPGHPSNERILEEIQRHWVQERQDLASEEDD